MLGHALPLVKIACSNGTSVPHLIRGSFGSPDSAFQLASQLAISSAVSAQLMGKSPILYNGSPTSSGGSGPPSNTWFLGPIQTQNPNGIWIDSAVFAQITAECPCTLQWAAPSHLKIAPFHRGVDPRLIRGSLGPPESWPKWQLDRFSCFCRAH